MRSLIRRATAFAAVTLGVGLFAGASPAWADQPWQDPSQPPSQRADELLAALSAAGRWAMAPGRYVAYVATSSEDTSHGAPFALGQR